MSLFTEQHELARICGVMQGRGMRIDLARLNEVKKLMADDKLHITKQFTINLRSSDQVVAYFKEHYDLQLPNIRKETIRDAATHNPQISELAAIADFKDLGKGVEAWVGPKYLVGDRVHPRWNPTGTVERRLSCSSPNFQNVPHRNPYFSDLLRSVVIPEPGCVLVEFDYSQGEDWSTAFAAKDQLLLTALKTGMDFHSRTAEYIYGHPCPKKTHKKERNMGKQWNHAHKYGQGFKFAWKGTSEYRKVMANLSDGLMVLGWETPDYIVAFSGARMAEITWGDRSHTAQKKALDIKRKLMNDYKGIVQWQQSTFENWQRTGTVTNPYGFGRPLYGKEDECAKRGFAFIGASTLQTPVIRGMIDCDALGFWQSAQIHDSLLFSLREATVDSDIKTITEIIERDRDGLAVPSEFKSGARWNEC